MFDVKELDRNNGWTLCERETGLGTKWEIISPLRVGFPPNRYTRWNLDEDQQHFEALSKGESLGEAL